MSDAISIRPATHDDLPAIVQMRDDLNALELDCCPHAAIQRLSVDAFRDLWGATFDDPKHCWRLVECAGRLVGFGLIYLLPKAQPPTAFIHWAYLAPGERRQGLGQRLFDHLASWARDRGATRIELQYIEGNETARRFWTKMGFRSFARKCVVYLDNERGTGP